MRHPRLIRLFSRSLLVLLVSLPVILLLLTLQGSPQILPMAPLDQQELVRVEQLLLDATPERPAAAIAHELHLDPEELNLLLRHALELLNLAPRWAAQFDLYADRLQIRAGIELLGGSRPVYLNVDGRFQVIDNQLQLGELHLGNLQVPMPLVQFALSRWANNLAASQSSFQEIRILLANIRSVSAAPTGVTVSMDWDPELVDRISRQAPQLFVTPADQRRIAGYYEQISLLAAAIPSDLGAVSLNTFLVPLFETARQRTDAGSDPIAENRTVLQTLAIYVNDEDIAHLLGEEMAAGLPAAKFVEVRLHRRQDLAQHLISIAAISASAGAGFAELLSNTKEAYDARYRSGFSFSDLAANSVGTQLASYATRDTATARLMQDRLANLSNESDYMPEIGNNRDGISESEFTALYEDRNSIEYQARFNEIQDLIAARPIFQGLP